MGLGRDAELKRCDVVAEELRSTLTLGTSATSGVEVI